MAKGAPGGVQGARLAGRGLHVDVRAAVVRAKRVHREALHVVVVAAAPHEVVPLEGLLARVLRAGPGGIGCEALNPPAAVPSLHFCSANLHVSSSWVPRSGSSMQ